MAPRSARRARAGQSARNLAAVQRREFLQAEKNLTRVIARSIQEVAVRSMNGLAEAGPAWSGEFAASWGFSPAGQRPQIADGGLTDAQGIKRYTKNDAPVRRIERYLANGVSRFNIVNVSDHAEEAVDGKRARFVRPNNAPIKENALELGTSRDNPSLRHEIGDSFSGELRDAPAARTAEQDWLDNYVKGGLLQKDLADGVSFAFSDVDMFSP
jgi:hypothetical protein